MKSPVARRTSEHWTDAQLLSYSRNHLYYEISMFFWCGALLRTSITHAIVTPFIKNLIVEGFGIHLRALLEFFCRLESNHKDCDDILAVDYMGASAWTKPTLSKAANAAWSRVNKEVGHLTVSRKDDGDPAKDWNQAIDTLMPAIMAICQKFVRLADPNKLAQEVRQFCESAGG